MNIEKRNYELILYDLDKVYEVADLCIKQGFDYAYILHDKDLKDDKSDYKKAHYHFQLFMPHQKSINRVGQIFDIPINYIEVIHSKKSAIRYLIHADNNEKENYDIFAIKSNFDLTNYFNNLISDENIEMEIIFDFINRNKHIKMIDVYKYVLDNNIWSTYRRNYSIIKDLIYEHNFDISTNIILK